MKLHCPQCGVKGSADDSYSGQKVKCPRCHGVFEVTRDVSVELSEDAVLLSATTSTSAKSSTPAAGDAVPITPREGTGNNESAQALSIEEAEEMLVFEDDVIGSGPEIPLPAQELAVEEETLDWDDIASEIDLQIAEGEFGAEQENIPDGSPVDLSSLDDAVDQPPAGETVAPEVAPVAGNYDQQIAEDEAQLVAEKDTIEFEPYGIDKKQCWQCGKSDSASESFSTRDGRLYCTDCAPVDDSVKTADTKSDQETYRSDLTAGATDETRNEFSFGAVLKKVWAKIKGVFFS